MKANRPSSTALLIARATLLADETPALKPMLLPGSARLSRQFLQAAGPAWWFDFALRHHWSRSLLFGVEQVALPGIILHFFARKALLDRLAQEALAAGCRQIVVLGAGLDTLAWRWKKVHPSLPCFEIDHPATQGVKATLQNQTPQLATPKLIPADLNQISPADLLRAEPSFQPQEPTFLVAEGLLMYLPPAKVSWLFRELAGFAAPGSRFAFSWMEKQPGKRLRFHQSSRAIDWWLRWRKEPFQWELARHEVETFATEHGWQLEFISTPEEMRRRFLAPHGLEHRQLATGESVALFRLEKSED